MRANLTSSLLLLAVACLLGCDRTEGPADSTQTSKPVSSPAVRRDKKAEPPNFARMPNLLGRWKGIDRPLSKEILAAVGADVVVNRNYVNLDDSAAKVSHHLAVFSDWSQGIFNNPISCYKAAGWKLRDETVEPVYIDSLKSFRMSISRWERGRESVMVMYWYQLGNHVLLKRSELESLRSELKDLHPPPRLIKVLSQLPMGAKDVDQAKTTLKRLAVTIREWIDAPYYDP